MKVSQLNAFAAQLHAALTHAEPGETPAPFPFENVVRARQDHPRDVRFWCTYDIGVNTSDDAEATHRRQATPQTWRLSVIAEPAADVTADVEPNAPGLTFASVTVSPQGNATATRDKILSDLQAFTSATHPVDYTADDTQADPAITIAAQDSATGVALFPSISDLTALALTLRLDNMVVDTRDLTEQIILVQISSRLLEPNPSVPGDPNPIAEHDAMQLAKKVRLRLRTTAVQELLNDEGVGILRFDGPRPLSHLQGGSQWETRASLLVTCRVQAGTVDQPGTIEHAVVSGTLLPDSISIDFDTRT